MCIICMSPSRGVGHFEGDVCITLCKDCLIHLTGDSSEKLECLHPHCIVVLSESETVYTVSEFPFVKLIYPCTAQNRDVLGNTSGLEAV